MNTQDWSPLGWTGWTSSQSKGLSRVFSNTTVQKDQFFGARLSSQSSSHIHTWPLEKPRCHINNRMGLFEHMPDLDSAHCCCNHRSKDSFLHVMYQELVLVATTWIYPEHSVSALILIHSCGRCAVFLVAQSCPTLCDPMDCSPPGSSVHGILQARKQEWLPCPPPGDLPDPGIEPRSPALQVASLPSEAPGKPSLKWTFCSSLQWYCSRTWIHFSIHLV